MKVQRPRGLSRPRIKDSAIIRTYRRYAPFYDYTFGIIFDRGRKLTVQNMRCKPGDRILEVGVGTGLSLSLYPPSTYVVGIDICAEMLSKAVSRTAKNLLTNVSLVLMNAQQLAFRSSSFDKVVAMYVASVVPDPRQLMKEMIRVCKPGGDIFVVNHFSNNNPIIRTMELLLCPLSNMIGFRPVFEIEELLSGTSVHVVEKKAVSLFGHWTLVHAKNGTDLGD